MKAGNEAASLFGSSDFSVGGSQFSDPFSK
jgi:hypothetical protein